MEKELIIQSATAEESSFISKKMKEYNKKNVPLILRNPMTAIYIKTEII